MRCPLCGSFDNENLIELYCGNFDQSELYDTVRIVGCNICGHVFNKLFNDEKLNLKKYYNNEYSVINMASQGNKDMPGSLNLASIKRYENIWNLMAPYPNNYDANILDVGCAQGGFLAFLDDLGFHNLYGIDTSANYIKPKDKNLDLRIGAAESIPFDSNSMDFIIMDQVLEHVINPSTVINECSRVLKPDGTIIIAVPNAMAYGSEKCNFFPFYWFLLREHIHHWDIKHLDMLAGMLGLYIFEEARYETAMMSDKMILPNLIVSLKKESATKKKEELHDDLAREIKQYISNEKKSLKQKVNAITKLIIHKTPVYIWGIGREFMLLWDAGLLTCNVVNFIDTNLAKQGQFTVENFKIYDPSIINPNFKQSAVVITAYAHVDEIKEYLKSINYQGEVIVL